MSQKLVVSVTLTTMTCGRCSGIYAISEDYRVEQYRKAGHWHCPYCRSQWGYSETDIDRLKKELDARTQALFAADKKLTAEKARHDQTKAELEHTERRRRAAKAQTTKLKNKIHGGQCPCCDLRFENLQEHMQTAHPEFLQEEQDEDAAVVPTDEGNTESPAKEGSAG